MDINRFTEKAQEAVRAAQTIATRNGNRLGRNEMLRRLKDVAGRAGVQHATLHKFRHTYATRHLQDGIDIRTLQQWIGHRDIQARINQGSLAAFAEEFFFCAAGVPGVGLAPKLQGQ